LLNSQWKNRCSRVSSGGLVQRRQLYQESSCCFFLFRMFLVFNLSEMRS
jgi:hypothetical protein